MVKARLELETYKAKRERLNYEIEVGSTVQVETVVQVFGKQIAEAKSAVMAVGKHARSHIPHLSPDDVVTIEELCRVALEGLSVTAIQKDAPSDDEK